MSLGLLGMLLVALFPIVARAAHALRRQAEELRRRSAIVDATDDAIVTADRAGVVTSWNRGAQRLFGYEAEEMVGQPLGRLAPEALRQEQTALVGRILCGEPPAHHETTCMHKGGDEVRVSLTISALSEGAGAATDVVAIARDVRERDRAQAELKRYATELEALAVKDPLTELLNHRGFHEALDREIERAKREAGRMSVVLLDLDGFKRVNDARGHAEGDRVLRAVGDAIRFCCRPSDSAGRLGGDEFAVLAPGATCEQGRALAERVQRSIQDTEVGVGVSFGVAEWPRAGPEKEVLLFRADMDLYAAKPSRRDGRLVEEAGMLALTAARGAAHEGARELLDSAHGEGIRQVLAVAREHLSMDIAYVSDLGGGQQELRTAPGSGTGMVPGQLQRPLRDADHDPRGSRALVTDHADVGSYVGVPVRLSRGRLRGRLCAASPAPGRELAERDIAFLHVLARLVGDQLERTELELELRRLDIEAGGIRALLAALDARDQYTSSHSQSVVDLSHRVAQELDLPSAQRIEVQQVALLHDIGKLGIPDTILQKPGKLDEHEWEVMRRHSAIGAEIVESIPALAHLGPPIRAEHERWDGRGYPDGLAAEAIPLASRIVSACDAYHAMTSDRPYRPALSHRDAQRQLRANAGTQFDRAVTQALLRVDA